jgi:hypothetical protein
MVSIVPKNCPFFKSSQNSGQAKKTAKILASNLNLKVQNIYMKPPFKPYNIYNKPCFETAYLGKNVKNT